MAGKRPSAKAIGLMVAVFVLGVVVGGLGTVLLHNMRESARRDHVINRLSRELRLSAQQRRQIQAILGQAHQRFSTVFQKSQEEARPQYDAIRKDVHARIRAILTPAQQAKFDDFLKRLDAEHRIHPRPGPRRRRR